MPVLIVKPSRGGSYRVPLEAERCSIGRAKENDVNLLEDLSTSRFHAEITWRDGHWWLRDLGSRHGTTLNGSPVTSPMRLSIGDEIVAGQSNIRFADEDKPWLETEAPETLPRDTITLPVDDIVQSTVHSGQDALGLGIPTESVSPQNRAFGILVRATEDLLAQRPLEQVLDHVLDMVFEACAPEHAAILLLQGEPPELVAKAERGGPGRIRVSKTIAELVIRGQNAVLTRDAQVDERLLDAYSVMQQGIRSAMCVPLWNNKEVIGLIYLDSMGEREPFAKDDLLVITLLANVAAVKIENVRLFLRDQAMREMERELSAASRIQQRLQPAAAPEADGYEFAGINIPCRAVGGDTYDFQYRDENRLAIALADASGKGMGAALIIAMFQAAFRAHSATGIALSELISRLNCTVCENAEPGKFITLFCAELDLLNHRLHFVNAGHNPPILMHSNGDSELLHTGGLILGYDPEVVYKTDQAELLPGSITLVYSDGITESRNAAGEEFGEDRLKEALRACLDRSAQEIQDHILATVQRFSATDVQEDDITLSLVKRVK